MYTQQDVISWASSNVGLYERAKKSILNCISVRGKEDYKVLVLEFLEQCETGTLERPLSDDMWARIWRPISKVQFVKSKPKNTKKKSLLSKLKGMGKKSTFNTGMRVK